MEFQCRICGSVEKPMRHDTYWYCSECGVLFKDPKKFSEEIVIDEFEDPVMEKTQESEDETWNKFSLP